MAITGAGTVAVTNLHATVNADLSNITATTHTATASTDFSFSGQLGTANVILLDGVDMTVTAGEAKGNTFTGTAGGNAETILVTLANANAADKNADLTTITLATEATLASVTVTDSLTFTGTLHGATVTSVADSAVLSLVAAKAHDKTIDKSGTTGKVIADATVDAGITLAGSAHHDVTNLISALDASAVTGNLAVTLAADTASSVVVGGTGTNTIDGDLLTNGQTLTITGDKAVSVSLVAGDVDASAVTVSAVTVTATTGSNIIQTGAGDDTIDAGGAVDNITGGAGQDTITGGAGADIFVYASGDSILGTITERASSGADIITDFASESDIIDYAATLAIGGNHTTAGAARAQITEASGLAVFHTDDDTFAERLVAVAASLNEGVTDGHSAMFTDGTETYVYIIDATAGNTTGDTLIHLDEFAGATMAFDSGNLTIGT
jgi:Ca2+-binding RTX toxin-like protein